MFTLQAKKCLQVAVGLILRQKKLLIAQRPANTSHAGCWEFPGGKIEAGESIELALERELNEEVGIQVIHADPFKQYHHQYPEYQVILHSYFVREFMHEPYGKEGQLVHWVDIHELKNYTFPSANLDLVEDLLGIL